MHNPKTLSLVYSGTRPSLHCQKFAELA